MIYRPVQTPRGWRIVLAGDDRNEDLCGAVNWDVALVQAAILNQMLRLRSHPAQGPGSSRAPGSTGNSGGPAGNP